jgi:type VI secretion system secreted protein VgrG
MRNAAFGGLVGIAQEKRALAVDTPLGEDVLVLASFAGEEEMSRLFHYRLEMFSEEDSIAAKKIVGKNVTFRAALADGTPRYFNGVVSRFAAGDRETGLRRYYAEVVPWLWFLTRTADCRIFQNKSVPEIIEQVFKDLGFSGFDPSKIKGTHKKRDYCVQYRETDFNFVSRLMEEEGIFYYFKHADGKHTMVLADQVAGYHDLPEKEVEYEYSYSTSSGADRQAKSTRLTRWEHQYEFIPGKWAQTDYNFKDQPARGEPTPSKLLMTDEKSTIALDNLDKFEIYDYPGQYADKDAGRALTKFRMEEEEAAHDVVRGEGWCKTFTPGGKFKVKRHDCKAEEGKGFVVTSVRHTAKQLSEFTKEGDEEYGNSFTCIPDSVPFRPRRTTPKPTVRGVQPAVVTGPAGEEIWPDSHGRVKVQFFWDREGKRDENSSCWVRVSQGYGGKGWGSVTIPRIGQEVIVDFVEGDPDQPIITGRDRV